MPTLLMIFELRTYRPTGRRNGDAKVNEMKELTKPFIRTSPKVTVKHLKKYLAMKLEYDRHDDIELTCQDEVLGTDHTLEFIKKTRWHENSNLVLRYKMRNR
uniref:RAWUL domain-containing protein n=2 Tax=Lotharella oceanica TaxID=641309 RepID=A0A7S2TTK2_9EUKA|mmetsp:Transcript_29305/g.54858  ORF Transcript_29305/g.54858 Transcript_29305/m.54858 type:complete len:102 (+) Transcript_29305:246-551(+)